MDMFCHAILADNDIEPTWSPLDVTEAKRLILECVEGGIHANTTEFKSNRWNSFYKTAKSVDKRWTIMS